MLTIYCGDGIYNIHEEETDIYIPESHMGISDRMSLIHDLMQKAATEEISLYTNCDYMIRELNTFIIGTIDNHDARNVEDTTYFVNNIKKVREIHPKLFDVLKDNFKVIEIKLDGTECAISINNYGFSVEYFDKFIRDMNKLQDSILYGI